MRGKCSAKNSTLGPVGNHASKRAASRSAVGPLPPIQMGGPPRRCGFGSMVTSSREKCLPWKLTWSRLHSAWQISRSSRRRPTRRSKGTPTCWNSLRMFGTSPAMPTPRMTRPSAMRSRVATTWARTTGLRSAGSSTAVPRRTRFVRAATAARRVSGSWRGRAVMESPIHTESKPRASARSAMERRGPVSWRPDITASRVGMSRPNSMVIAMPPGSGGGARLLRAEVEKDTGVVAPAALARMGLAVGLRGPRLLDPPQHEAGPDEGVDVLGERAVKARHGEARGLGGRVGEAPSVDPPGGIEVFAHHPAHLFPRLVVVPVRALRDEARMRDAEGKETARPQHAKGLAEGLVEARPVHESHEGDHRVEARVGEHAELCVRCAHIANAQRRAALLGRGELDHALGEIDAGHAGARAGEEARVVTFATARVQHVPGAEIAHESEERRIVEPLAGHVVTLAHLLRPGAGVDVPVARDVVLGDLGLAHGQPLAGVRASMDTIPAPGTAIS